MIFVSIVLQPNSIFLKRMKNLPMLPLQKLTPFSSYHQIISLFCLLFFCNFTGLSAQDSPQQMSLQQCIDFALKNQSSVQNAQLDEYIAQKKVKEILGLGLPQLNGSVDVQDMIQRPTQLLPGEFFGAPPGTYIPIQFGTKYNATAGVSASQLIFDGTYLVGVKASTVYVELARKNLSRAKIDAVEAVQKAYYSVVINNERLKLLEANVKRLRKIFQDTKSYQENGFAEKIDVDRLAVTLSNLEVEYEKVTRLLDVSKYLLKFQMGMPVNNQITLTDSLQFKAMIDDLDANADHNNRIEFSLLETQKDLYRMDIKRHRSGYLPSLAAYGSLSTMAQRNKFNFLDTKEHWYATSVIGARLTIPIFDGFQKSARIQQAKLTLQKVENDQLNLKNLIDFQVSSARITYENSYKTLDAQKKNMDLAQEIARVSQIKYKEGVGSNLEVVTAETELRQAQTNYFDALYNTIIANIDLQKAKGTLY